MIEFEEIAKSWKEKGYTAVKKSEATTEDYKDKTKVIIMWA